MARQVATFNSARYCLSCIGKCYGGMIKFLTLFTIFFASANEDLLLRSKLLSLEDFSSRISIGLNSFEGKDEELLQKWIKENNPQKPFFIKVRYGNSDVGIASDGSPIKSATIYVVNPQKITGGFWWKKAKIYYLKEPDWTFFLRDNKALKDIDTKGLKSLWEY